MVTLIWRRGEIAHVAVLGSRNLAEGLPMERDTLFRIASMTKPVTSVAAMMLIEEGKLKLDDPIKRWMPEFANARACCRRLTVPSRRRSPAARDITVDDLFTHRGGLAYAFTSVGPIAKVMEEKLPPGLAPDPWLAALGSIPLSYQPGRALPLQPFDRRARIPRGAHRRHEVCAITCANGIFEPLGMHDTDFWTSRRRASSGPRSCTGPTRNPDSCSRFRSRNTTRRRCSVPAAVD